MTTTPLTDQQLDLDAIEATVTDQHLTPGPWDLAYESCDCGGDYPCGHGPYVTGVITPVPTSIAAERCKRTGEEPRDYDFHRGEIGDFTEADWALMVSARQNMPALVAEVRRLRAQVAELEPDVAFLAALEAGGVDSWEGYDDARAAVETDGTPA